MTQIATVTEVTGPGTVRVTVARQTACGHDCGKCAGCGAQAGSVTVTASRDMPLREGDRVEIYSGGRVLGIAALVYLLPVALFLACYLLFPGLGEGQRYAVGGCGFALGLAVAAGYDRRARREGRVTYRVTRKL